MNNLEFVRSMGKMSMELVSNANINIPKDIKFGIEDLGKHTYGECNTRKKEIMVNSRLFDVVDYPREKIEQVVRDVLVHEVLHLTKGSDGHDPIFKKACKKMNELYDNKYKCQTRLPSEDCILPHKYTLECKVCGNKYYMDRIEARKKANPNKFYRCHCHNSDFILTQNH